jgi:hypothetical protein
MKKSPTLFVIAFVLLAGLVLIPFVGVQGQVFRWQNYSGLYETPTPGPNGAALLIDHVTGQPGSFFLVSGYGYPANTTVRVFVNSVDLGSVDTDSNGEFEIIFETNQADLGRYEVLVEAAAASPNADSAVAVFFLILDGDLHPLTGEAEILEVPEGIAELFEYLPVIERH